jgi:RNA polymerase sigma-70 factor (ECF subfamily)
VGVDVHDPDVAAMLRLRDGDDLALNELMDRWQRRVTGYLLRLTGDHTTACDLAEETFVQVYQGRGRYRPAGAFSTWLFGIATNLSRNLARWQRRHPAVSMDVAESPGGPTLGERIEDGEPIPGAGIQANERAALVRDAVLALPADQRQAIVLFEYEDLSHEEIAAVMGCTAKAVEARLYRARATLRDRLERLLG